MLDVNGTINATSILINNDPIGGSQWTTVGTTNIYFGGKVGIGIAANPGQIFQVGNAGRLRIANDTGDYTVIGTNDSNSITNTKITIFGSTSSTQGCISYNATTSTGYHTFLTNGSDRMIITATGAVGIGVASPLSTLHVAGTGAGNYNGSIIATGDITAYYSDERLKTKISTINNPLSIVNKLHGFYYIPNEIATKYGINKNKIEIGLSAQDVQKVLPELVKLAPFDMKMNEAGEIISKSGEKYLTISYERIVPVLVEAIKELNQKNISSTNENNTTIKIDEHRAIINSLEERIKELETKITRILNHINI